MSKGGRKALVDPLPVDNLEKAEQPRISDESDPKVENVAPPADSYDEYEADWSAPVQDPCGGLATDAGDEVATEASPQAGSSTDAAGGLATEASIGSKEGGQGAKQPFVRTQPTGVPRAFAPKTHPYNRAGKCQQGGGYTKLVGAFIDEHCRGTFGWNGDGQHAIHVLADKMKDKTFPYSEQLWMELMQVTHERIDKGVNVQTLGPRPTAGTSVLTMAAAQPWKAKGCQPKDQLKMVDELLNTYRADPDLRPHRGNTTIMAVAGAGHWQMFQYFYF